MESSPFERIGCSTLTYRMLPLEAALERIRALGFRAVDICIIPGLCPHADPLRMTRKEMVAWARLVRASGLKVNALNVGHGPFNEEEGLSERMRFLDRCVELAHMVHAPVVTIPTGREVPSSQWKEHARRVARLIHGRAPKAAAYGVHLSIEAPHVHSLCTTTDQAVRLLEFVADGRVTLTLDTSHACAGGDPIGLAVRKMGPWIGHVHLRDCRRGDVRVTPGDGDVNFRELFGALSGRRYTGAITLEIFTREEDPDMADHQVRRAMAHLQTVLGGR